MIRSIKFLVVSITAILVTLYVLYVAYLYFNQENMLFQPEVLTKDYKFSFQQDFEEMYIPVEKDIKLHGVLFKTSKPKGLVFCLHGNGGSVKGWGDIAPSYNEMGYDIFILDYRGYGKSGGKIGGETLFYDDVKKAYAYVLEKHPYDKVIITGYSIGTGSAAMLASQAECSGLVLMAPYYSLKETINATAPFMPDFLQKYDFETYKFVKEVKIPVCIFHGNADNLLPVSNSEKLKLVLKPDDTIVILDKQGHNGINQNPLFVEQFEKFSKKL